MQVGVGDRVRRSDRPEWEGTIVEVRGDGNSYCVDWDNGKSSEIAYTMLEVID